jgi:hypothetical protein
MGDEVDFYATPGPMTKLDGVEHVLRDTPDKPSDIVAMVQGLVLHPFWAGAYGVDLAPERAEEVQIRPASGIVERALELDSRPLIEPREPALRFAGNCRHFSTLTVALLRRAGVPSRARCGFAGYFEAGKWVDHWVVEHWDGTRWVMLDAQIDGLQRQATGLAADPADLPPGQFLPAGDAWLRCQSGELDGDRFGILDMWGKWFITGNIARDLAALNKVEMLPWDGWGTLADDRPPAGGDAYVDEIATLTTSGDHAAIRQRYETDDGLRVPSHVKVFFTSRGPTEADVPELV